MKILIVDDSTTIRRIIKRTCEEMKHDVAEAADGRQALDTLAEKADGFGLIVLDWNMPGLFGLETLKKIKGDPKTGGIPVLMLTSEADFNFVKEALAAGAENYITKPFDQKMLGLKINETLAMAQA